MDTVLPDLDFLVELLNDCAQREQNNMERGAERGIEAEAGAQAAVDLVFELANQLENGELTVEALVALITSSDDATPADEEAQDEPDRAA